jgi:hypothetical protein
VAKEDKKRNTIKYSIILSVTLSILIIIAILYFTIDAETIDKLRSVKIRYEFFGLAVLLNVLWWFLWGARLKILSNAIDPDVKISLWKSTKIVITNLFLAGITPSMAGGEPVRIYLLKNEGMNVGSSTAAVLGERLIDAIFILMVIPFAIFIFKDEPEVAYLAKGLWIGIFIFIIAIVVFIYAIVKPEKTKSFLLYLNKKFNRFTKKKDSKRNVISRINREVDNFHNSMTCFVGHKKRSFLFASIVTVLFWSAGFFIPSMIMLGLGLDPFFIESYAAQILLLVIVMMPTTPGSSGVAELGIAGLYSVLIGGSIIGVFTILYRFISYHMNLIAGAIFQYRIFKSVASFSMDRIKGDGDSESSSK